MDVKINTNLRHKTEHSINIKLSHFAKSLYSLARRVQRNPLAVCATVPNPYGTFVYLLIEGAQLTAYSNINSNQYNRVSDIFTFVLQFA